MQTLHEIAVDRAKKQPGMADALTEDAPILDVVKWKPATHGLWNVAEKLTEITGAGFVEPDAPLPMMSAGTDLVHTDLHVLGGTMEVPSQRAWKFGGAAKYFADRQNFILKQAGMDTEKQLVYRNWLRAAVKSKNLKNAGGKGDGWFILAVRFCELNNVGLYDPDQFQSGRLFKIEALHGGKENYLIGPKNKGILGYTVVYRANFGWQIIDASRTCAAIVNIDETHKPTAMMIDDMLADVRSQPGSTYLFCSPKAKIYGLDVFKTDHIQMVMADKKADMAVETWSGIRIVTSHNLSEKEKNIPVPA